MEYLNIFVIIVFILLFYIYGLGLSKIIDYIFPDIDTKHDYIIILETLFEITITYLIFFMVQNHIIKVCKKSSLHFLVNIIIANSSAEIFNYIF